MSLKEVFAPHLGRNIKFGRKPSPPRSKLHLGDYLYLDKLPPPPSACDYSSANMRAFRNIFGNDFLGDCVVADNYHAQAIITANAGSEFVATASQIVADYETIGGYVPGNPSTDNGCDPEVALQHYATVGYADGTKLAGWFAVDGTNVTLIKQALYLFENLAIAVNLPDRWISPFPSGDGFLWDLAGPPDPNYGHELTAYGYDNAGLLIASWGLKGHMPWSAVAEYATTKAGGNLYGRPSWAMINKATAKAPNGLNLYELTVDVNAMSGRAPLPLPPAPRPTPVPIVPPPPAPIPVPGPVDPNTGTWNARTRTLALPAGWKGVPYPFFMLFPDQKTAYYPKGWTVSNQSAPGAGMPPFNLAHFLANVVKLAAYVPQVVAVLETFLPLAAASAGRGKFGDTPLAGPTFNPDPASVEDQLLNDDFLGDLEGQLTAAGYVPPALLAIIQADRKTARDTGAAWTIADATAKGLPAPEIVAHAGKTYEINPTTPPTLAAVTAIPAASILAPGVPPANPPAP